VNKNKEAIMLRISQLDKTDEESNLDQEGRDKRRNIFTRLK